MKSQLYIPKKLKIGFQKRSGTFLGTLAYIIYFDDKNVLRKETSWNSWRDKKIEPQDFDNIPTSGFVINKDVSRYNWGHFSSNKSYIRIHDPRGFEFEITPENLIGILMNGDCSRRTLDGDFVYSWHGKDLVLLPCNSEEYQSSSKFTALQAQKVSAKTLVPGCVYLTKNEGNVTYMGRFSWFNFTGKKSDGSALTGKYISDRSCDDVTWSQSSEKKHIFYIGKQFVPKSNMDFLADQVTTSPVENYADLMDQFNGLRMSSKIVNLFLRPTKFSTKIKEYTWGGLEQNTYFVEKDGYFEMRQFHVNEEKVLNPETHVYEKRQDSYREYGPFIIHALKWQDGVIHTKYVQGEHIYNNFWRSQPTNVYSEADLNSKGLCNLYALLENGKTVRLKSWMSFREEN